MALIGINKIINYTSKVSNIDHLVRVQTLGSGIHVEVTLTHTAQQNIVAHQGRPSRPNSTAPHHRNSENTRGKKKIYFLNS